VSNRHAISALTLVLTVGLLLGLPPAAIGASIPAADASVSSQDVAITGSLGTTKTFQATVTRSAAQPAGFLNGARPADRWDSFTGKYYYSTDRPVWTYTTSVCMTLNLVEWKECMAFRIYYVTDHATGAPIVVWGKNYTFSGLRGSQTCHAPGSKSLFAYYSNQQCGEHRYDPDVTRMKQWDLFSMDYNPGPKEVYAFHVNMYASGYLSPVYSGLGA
jgi:hypothetical protein